MHAKTFYLLINILILTSNTIKIKLFKHLYADTDNN
jgi:hypothetical protein